MQHRVALLTANTSRNDEGEFDPPYIFATTWASVTLLQGRELDKAQQIVSEVTHKVVIPYMLGVESDQLVQFDGRLFQIQARQDPDERKVELHLLCAERNDGSFGEQ